MVGRLCLGDQGVEGCQATLQQVHGLSALSLVRRQPGGDFSWERRVPVNVSARLVRLRDSQTISGRLLLTNAQSFPQLQRAGVNRLSILAQCKHII
ncbi:hypothetical protein D3C78_1761360 [compost metagenome]